MSADGSDKYWARDGGIYFGYGSKSLYGCDAKQFLRHQLRYVGDGHILSIGPSGSGKTSRVLFPNVAELNSHSLVVVDPKGKLAKATMAHRAKHSRVILLNPFDEHGLGSDGFNPVAVLDPKSPAFPDNAMGLAEAIVRVEGVEPHFSASAQELVCALIMYVRLVFPNPSLGHVRSLLGLSSAQFQKLVITREFEYDDN